MTSIRMIAAALAFVAAPAVADTMVVASPGITLTEAAQAKFNRDTRGDDRQVTPIPGSSEPTRQLYAAAGLSLGDGRSMSLEQVVVLKQNRESDGDAQQAIVAASPMASRAYGAGPDLSRLAASAGLDAEAASAMNLSDIAAVKFARDTGDD